MYVFITFNVYHYFSTTDSPGLHVADRLYVNWFQIPFAFEDFIILKMPDGGTSAFCRCHINGKPYAMTLVIRGGA